MGGLFTPPAAKDPDLEQIHAVLVTYLEILEVNGRLRELANAPKEMAGITRSGTMLGNL